MAKVFIEESSLTAIGDAIREKTGGSDLLNPLDMPEAIAAIETGGGGGDLPEEAFKVTGNCSYRFAYNGWNWLIENYGKKIKTENVSQTSYMFSNSSELEEIPFEINIRNNCKEIQYMFTSAQKLKEPALIKGELSVPTGNYSGVLNMQNIFASCWNLQRIPYDYFRNFGGDTFWEASKNYRGNRSYIFDSCYSLRQLPDVRMLKSTDTSVYNSIYYNFCNYCYALDEIIDLPVFNTCTYTSNAFYNTFYACHRLKDVIFETNEDGTPIVAQWKSQTINLNPGSTSNIGFGGIGFSNGVPSVTGSNVLKYNSGITADKVVTDDTSYQALKNDADWCTGSSLYSRYNHDSAVRTINSLPDTSAYLASAGGTNTIKFNGAAGELTDGGAINTLTEAEIAVAAAKGWTVTLS